ncbi:MAG: endo,4-beta-xylanase [Methylobacteriaceae bacterium]|jgi:endo-1,4-beta-xylanase|nr:endo,4-beta-xylanase [Methylobacteriaceae bacterium]
MIDLSRRGLLGAVGALAFAHAAGARAENYCSDGVLERRGETSRSLPLGSISKRVQWGVAIEQPGLYDPELVAALRTEAPRFLAIASGLKFGNLHPVSMAYRRSNGEPTWGECDDTIALAKELGVPVRGDCLAWNDWLPNWLTEIARKRPRGWQDQLRSNFEAHFEGVFTHFRQINPNPLRWCGIVNEPFNPWVMNGSEPAWRTGAWLDAFGIEADGVPRYIHSAFALGERYRSSQCALFINEANCENDRFGPAVRAAYLKLIDSLQKAGRHVDAVGLECHLVPQWMSDPARPDWQPFVQFLRDLAQRGIEIYFTELDVNDCSLRNVAQRDAEVETYIRSFVSAALEVPAVTMVSNWNLSDKGSWLREKNAAGRLNIESWAKCVAAPECPRPALYDETMNPKRARQGLAEALGGSRALR